MDSHRKRRRHLRTRGQGGAFLFPVPGEVVDLWLRTIGAARVTSVLGILRPETPWLTAARLLASDELEGALTIYRRVEAAPDVALVCGRIAERLVASGRQREADPYVEEALAFYRSVGATRYIAQTEKLLPATA